MKYVNIIPTVFENYSASHTIHMQFSRAKTRLDSRTHAKQFPYDPATDDMSDESV